MNATLVTTYIRQRLASRMRLALLAMTIVFPLGAVALGHSLMPLAGLAGFWGMLFAAGAIGQDVSSGTLQLLLARPVTRPEYVSSRWVASGLAATGVLVVMLGLGMLILLASGDRPSLQEPALLLLSGATSAFGSAAVMVMLSALADGLGDVAIMIAAGILLQMTTAFATWREWHLASRISEHIQQSLTPSLSFGWMFARMPPSWFEITAWASTVTFALAIAIVRLNRRELSYAAAS